MRVRNSRDSKSPYYLRGASETEKKNHDSDETTDGEPTEAKQQDGAVRVSGSEG